MNPNEQMNLSGQGEDISNLMAEQGVYSSSFGQEYLPSFVNRSDQLSRQHMKSYQTQNPYRYALNGQNPPYRNGHTMLMHDQGNMDQYPAGSTGFQDMGYRDDYFLYDEHETMGQPGGGGSSSNLAEEWVGGSSKETLYGGGGKGRRMILGGCCRNHYKFCPFCMTKPYVGKITFSEVLILALLGYIIYKEVYASSSPSMSYGSATMPMPMPPSMY